MKELKQLLLLGAMLVGGSLLTACTVEETEEGELPDVDVSADAGAVPAYDVDVTQTEEGELPDVDVAAEGGELPRYDVDPAEVEVGSRQVDVTVPTVDVDVEEDMDEDDGGN